jgi:DNA integrity scanning protein DisA with diadenylate cyclase activity
VLTRRLTAMADLMVSKIQTTFIPRRNILDGVVILHEMRTKKKGVILKLNFEKAYDKVYSLFC